MFVSERAYNLLEKQIEELRQELLDLRSTSALALENQRKHYESALQAERTEKRKIFDRLCFVLNIPTAHDTVTLPPQPRPEDLKQVQKTYPPGVASVIRAMQLEDDEYEERRKQMIEAAKRTVEKQKERDGVAEAMEGFVADEINES